MSQDTDERLCSLGAGVLARHLVIMTAGLAIACLAVLLIEAATTAAYCILFFQAGAIVGRYLSALSLCRREKKQ